MRLPLLAITMRGGQLYCQSYWHDLLKIIENGVRYFFIIIHLLGKQLILFNF
jgi:hypothetical protein